MLTVSLLAVVALIAADDPDGVVATAPAIAVQLDATALPESASPAAAAQASAPHGLTTDQQIARWIDDRSPETVPFADGRAPVPGDDRQMHSQFSVGVGTGGYRDYGVAVSVPLGETGRLNLSYRQVENGYPVYGYGGGYGYGSDYGYGYAPYGAPHAGVVSGDKAAGVFVDPEVGFPDRGRRLWTRPRD